MYTIPITYEDYNGVERTDTAQFNLTKAEIMEMQLSTEGGFGEHIQHIVDARDTPTLIKIFKEIILKSYGVKSADGRRFEKSEQLSTEFSQTEAFSQLYVKLATDADAATAFINNIVPRDVAEKAKANGGTTITTSATEVKKFEPQDHKPKQQ